MACPFCDIDEMKTRIIKRFQYCYLCLSNPRLMPGHLLVIPKRHVERLSELTQDERTELFDVAIKYQEKILKMHWGCDIRQNCRPTLAESRTKVNHVHIHLEPRDSRMNSIGKFRYTRRMYLRTLQKKR